MNQAINVTFVGISVVFIALILLAFIITFLAFILNGGKMKKSDKSGNVLEDAVEEQPELAIGEEAATQESMSTEELIAVLTAAIQASMGTGVDYNLKVKSIRRVSVSSPVWNVTGRSEYLAAKL